MKIILILVILSLIQSCSTTEEPAKFVEPNGSIDLKIDKPCFDTIILDSVENISLVGEMYVVGDKIGYIDQISGNLHRYSFDGKYIDKKLGYGKSNAEVAAYEITGFDASKDRYVIFSDLEYFIYDSSLTKIKQGIVKSKVRDTPDDEACGANPLIYSWSHRNRNIRYNNGKIFISSNLLRLNPYNNKDRYFNEGRTITIVDEATAVVDDVIARYPVGYKANNWESFNNASFDIDDNGDIYVSFEADSLIYVYNSNCEQFNTFGYSGRKMDSNYSKIAPSDTLYWAISADRARYGFYEKIEYDNQSGLLVRLYRRGNADKNSDGLQIYDGNVLIGDVDIPKMYNLMGFYGSTIYLYFIDLDNIKINVISFTLNGLDNVT